MSSSALSIRHADLNDFDTVISLLTQYRAFYRCDVKPTELKHFIQERIKNKESVILLAFNEGQAVGISQLYPCFSTLSLSKIWILNDLFVQETCRGKGIGKALIDASVDLAKKEGAKRIDLKTEHDNVTAKALYEKYGFQLDNTYAHYRFIIE